MDVEIKVDRKAVDKAILRMPMRCRKATADGLDHASRSFMSALWKERMQGPPGVKAMPRGIFHRFRRVTRENGKIVFLRAQGYQEETISKIAKSAKNVFDLSVEIYSRSKVSGILERGGTIRSSRPMPVPLNSTAREMLTKVGPKSNLRLIYPDLKAVQLNGKLFLARKQAFKKMQLLFILKKSVRIKPQLGFASTWAQHATRREQIINEAFTKALSNL